MDITQNKIFALYPSITYLVSATLSLHTLHFDGAMLSDGPATSFLSLFVLHYYEYLSKIRVQSVKINFIWASLFLALTCLWRPYFVLLYPIIILFEFYNSKNLSLSSLCYKGLLWMLPIFVLDLPWIIRNYITFGRFIPAQIDLYAGSCDRVCKAYRDFAKIAGDIGNAYNAPHSFACYFESINPSTCSFRFPFYMLGDNLSIKEIEKVKLLYARYRENRHDTLLQDSVIHGFHHLISCYRQDHPYLYWFYPRIIVLRKFFIHTGTFYFPSLEKGMQRFNKLFFAIVKISQAILYWIALLVGMIGLIKLTTKRIEAYMLLLIPVYLIALFPIYFLAEETRYFYAAYPMLVIGASIQIGFILKNIPLWKIPFLRTSYRNS